MEIENGRPAGPHLVPRARLVAHVEYFWLCGTCASVMTLLVDNGKVVAVSLDHGQFRRAAAS